MKFEIELTENDLEVLREECADYNTRKAVLSKIASQLPKKEKPWQERYKFLVGWINPQGGAAIDGGLNATDENPCGIDKKIYGFTKEQFVRAVNQVHTEWRTSFTNMTLAQIGERFLEKQEVEE